MAGTVRKARQPTEGANSNMWNARPATCTEDSHAEFGAGPPPKSWKQPLRLQSIEILMPSRGNPAHCKDLFMACWSWYFSVGILAPAFEPDVGLYTGESDHNLCFVSPRIVLGNITKDVCILMLKIHSEKKRDVHRRALKKVMSTHTAPGNRSGTVLLQKKVRLVDTDVELQASQNAVL
jgi:hypothetical protein